MSGRQSINSFLVRFLFVLAVLAVLIHPGSSSFANPGAIIYEDSIDYDQEEGKLSFPSFVYADRGRNELYVIDGKSRIIIYTSDLYPLFTLTFLRGVDAPQGLATDGEGNLYVVQSPSKYNSHARISVFSSCFRLLREIVPTGFPDAATFSPHRVAVDRNGYIYLAASRGRGAVVLDAQGLYIETMTPMEDGRVVRITNVSIDGSGRIYLVSEDRGRVYVYDSGRKLIGRFGEKGGSSGKLSRPRAVAVDDQTGLRYVLDRMRHTISVYDSSGEYLFEFGGLGNAPGWFQFPNDIAIDKDGRLIVADFFNHRVQILKTR